MPQEKVGLGERSVHGRVRKILWASEVSYATPHPSTSCHQRHVVSCKVLDQWSSPKHTIKFTCLLFSEISLLTTVIQDIYVQLAHVSLFPLIFEIHLIHSYEAMEYNLGWNFLQVRFKISSWPWRIWKLGFILIALQSFNQQKGKLGNRLSFLNPKLMENIRDIFFPYNIIFEQKIIIRLYLYSQQSSSTPSSTLKNITLMLLRVQSSILSQTWTEKGPWPSPSVSLFFWAWLPEFCALHCAWLHCATHKAKPLCIPYS